MRETSFKITACVCGVFLAVVASYAAGEEISREFVQDLGTSQVVSGTLQGPAQNAGSSFTEILPSAWEGRGLSAAEVLGALPGIQYYKQGGLGSFQTVSVRGIAARSIIVCVDGVPLNDASGGAVDLGQIDLNQVEKIEVYKDYVPVKFGGSGIGGAVNFVTKGSKLSNNIIGYTSGRALVGYGSHGSYEASLQLTSRLTDSVTVNAVISTQHSDNDYEFENRNGTPYNSEDDFTDKRENAEFTEHSGSFKLRALHANGVFSTFSGSVNYSEGGTPGREDYQTQVAGFEGERAVVSYRSEWPQLWNWLWLEMGVTGKFEKSVAHSYYPLDHIGYASTEFLQYGAAGYSLFPEITASYNGERLDASLYMLMNADYYAARGSSRDWNLSRFKVSPAFETTYRVLRFLAVGGNASVQFVKDDIHGGEFVLPTMSSRLESARSRDLSYAARGFIRLNPEAPWGASFSAGRYFREPQLMELYGVYPGVVSNPDLREETAFRLEAGAFVKSPSRKTLLQGTYFESHTDNGVVWLVSGSFMKPSNVGEALIRGFETELSSRPSGILSIVLRATFQNAVDRSGNPSYHNKKLPGEPAQSYLAEATLYLPFRLDFTWTSEYRSRIFSDRANRIEQPATARHRAALAYQPFVQTRIVFAADNLTGETYRNIYTPYPTPGREYKLTVTQGF